VRREQLKSYIETHLRDPGLCPERIAQAAHMSVRYLHRLFSDSGESVAHYILRRRLEECSRAFRDAAQREQTIKTLALRHGFNDVTHFGRVFRAHFGMTPGSYRTAEAREPASNP
jgi:AraC-like DNA-binding protein